MEKTELKPWFDEMLEILYKNYLKSESFDYPDYCGLPNRIANKLSADAVDQIDDCLHMQRDGDKPTKREFIKYMKSILLNGFAK